MLNGPFLEEKCSIKLILCCKRKHRNIVFFEVVTMKLPLDLLAFSLLHIKEFVSVLFRAPREVKYLWREIERKCAEETFNSAFPAYVN